MTNIFKKRTSIRKYTTDDVDPAMVHTLLSAAIEAPSAGNCQPWHFYVVRSPAIKQQLSACAHSQTAINAAPVVIVVCTEPQRSALRYAARGEDLYSIQDTAAAAENILLCATSLGLGACWYGAFDESAVQAVMHMPAYRRPMAIITVGYAKTEGRKPTRRPFEEVVTIVD